MRSNRRRRSRGIEVRPADPVSPDGSGGPDGGLEGNDVQVVPESPHRGGRRVEGGDPGTGGPDGVGLSGPDTAGTEPVGASDLGREADGAVVPGSPDADVVVLAGEVVLGGRHRARAGVPVEAGDFPGGGSKVGLIRLRRLSRILVT